MSSRPQLGWSVASYPWERSSTFWAYALGLPLALFFGFSLVTYSSVLLIAPMALGAIVLILWRPYLGYLLAVATLPADALGIIGGSGTAVVITVPKLVGVLTISAWGVDVLYRGQVPKLSRFITLPTVLASLFVLLNLIACAVHPTEVGVAELVRLVMILVFVIVSVHFIDRPQRVVHVVLAVVVTATLVALQSVVQRVFGGVGTSEEWVAQAGAVLDVTEEVTGSMLRTSGTFSHPAWLGLFLTTALPLTLFVLWRARHWMTALAAGGAAVVQILGVFSTYSRMAYVGVVLGVGLFAFRRRFGAALLVGLGVCAVLVYPVLPIDFRNRVESIVNYTESSSSLSRIGQQLAGVSMIRHNALIGVGPGNFEDEVELYGANVPERYRVQAIGAHNMYVELAAEIGIPGLMVVLLLAGTCLWYSSRLRRLHLLMGDGRQALLWECVGIAWIVFLVSALFVHAQYRKEWWLLVSLVAAGWSCRESLRRQPSAIR